MQVSEDRRRCLNVLTRFCDETVQNLQKWSQIENALVLTLYLSVSHCMTASCSRQRLRTLISSSYARSSKFVRERYLSNYLPQWLQGFGDVFDLDSPESNEICGQMMVLGEATVGSQHWCWFLKRIFRWTIDYSSQISIVINLVHMGGA